jgi:DNA-binding transcriptional MerR regulator
MEKKAIKRLYYSISEVSQITGLKPYVLRYWETEFPELRPSKNRAGNRIYRKVDINTIFMIKRLLYHEKYTIEGARQRLRQDKRNPDQLQLSLTDIKTTDMLHELRDELRELLKLLKESPGPDKTP